MQGLTALVTGGSSGIGLATTKMLLAEGANVAIIGRDINKLKAVASELEPGGRRLKYFLGDVSSEGYANKLVGETVKAFGALHILVNSAGVFRLGALLEMSEEDYDQVVDVNLKGTWLMCRFATRAIKESGGGAIVNVSSFLGIRGATGLPSSAYAAAKGGVLALTKSLAIELAPFKIRVNAVLPALVRTAMLAVIADEQGQEGVIEKARKIHPLGRIGEPEDVARAILFLCKPENDWITGAELTVDGGRSAI